MKKRVFSFFLFRPRIQAKFKHFGRSLLILSLVACNLERILVMPRDNQGLSFSLDNANRVSPGFVWFSTYMFYNLPVEMLVKNRREEAATSVAQVQAYPTTCFFPAGCGDDTPSFSFVLPY